MRNEPKQHHYIPQTYLKAFSNSDGFVSVYDLWNPGKHFRATPQKILKEKDLYTQPVHAESRFDIRMEITFAELEAKWPAVRDKLLKRVSLSIEESEQLFEFICLMRVRVPNTLKAVSKLLIETGEQAIDVVDTPMSDEVLQAFRKFYPDLAPKPGKSHVGAADLLEAGLANISVDPHRSLTALPHLVLSMAPIISRIGLLSFVHNRTPIDFITSDNPVIYFPAEKHDDMVVSGNPYSTDDEGHFDFIFPMTPRLAIRFSTRSTRRLPHKSEFSAKVVEGMNLQIAKFADRYLIAQSEIAADVVGAFPNICPVPNLSTSEVYGTGDIRHVGYRWGEPIKSLPKWEYDFSRE